MYVSQDWFVGRALRLILVLLHPLARRGTRYQAPPRMWYAVRPDPRRGLRARGRLALRGAQTSAPHAKATGLHASKGHLGGLLQARWPMGPHWATLNLVSSVVSHFHDMIRSSENTWILIQPDSPPTNQPIDFAMVALIVWYENEVELIDSCVIQCALLFSSFTIIRAEKIQHRTEALPNSETLPKVSSGIPPERRLLKN